MGLFGDIVGKDRLKVVHLNDSKGPLGERPRQARAHRHGADRGEGVPGVPALRGVAKLPILMEVPVDERRQDAENLKVVRRLIGG